MTRSRRTSATAHTGAHNTTHRDDQSGANRVLAPVAAKSAQIGLASTNHSKVGAIFLWSGAAALRTSHDDQSHALEMLATVLALVHSGVHAAALASPSDSALSQPTVGDPVLDEQAQQPKASWSPLVRVGRTFMTNNASASADLFVRRWGARLLRSVFSGPT